MFPEISASPIPHCQPLKPYGPSHVSGPGFVVPPLVLVVSLIVNSRLTDQFGSTARGESKAPPASKWARRDARAKPSAAGDPRRWASARAVFTSTCVGRGGWGGLGLRGGVWGGGWGGLQRPSFFCKRVSCLILQKQESCS